MVWFSLDYSTLPGESTTGASMVADLRLDGRCRRTLSLLLHMTGEGSSQFHTGAAITQVVRGLLFWPCFNTPLSS